MQVRTEILAGRFSLAVGVTRPESKPSSLTTLTPLAEVTEPP